MSNILTDMECPRCGSPILEHNKLRTAKGKHCGNKMKYECGTEVTDDNFGLKISRTDKCKESPNAK